MVLIFCSNKAAASSPKLDEGACASPHLLAGVGELWLRRSSCLARWRCPSARAPRRFRASARRRRRCLQVGLGPRDPRPLRNREVVVRLWRVSASARAALTAPPLGRLRAEERGDGGRCAQRLGLADRRVAFRSHCATCAWPRFAARSMLRLPVASCWLSAPARAAALPLASSARSATPCGRWSAAWGPWASRQRPRDPFHQRLIGLGAVAHLQLRPDRRAAPAPGRCAGGPTKRRRAGAARTARASPASGIPSRIAGICGITGPPTAGICMLRGARIWSRASSAPAPVRPRR